GRPGGHLRELQRSRLCRRPAPPHRRADRSHRRRRRHRRRHNRALTATEEHHRPITLLMTLPTLARWGTWGWARPDNAEVAIWPATFCDDVGAPADPAPAEAADEQSNWGPRADWRGARLCWSWGGAPAGATRPQTSLSMSLKLVKSLK